MGFVPYTGLFILGSNDIFGAEAAKLCPPPKQKNMGPNWGFMGNRGGEIGSIRPRAGADGFVEIRSGGEGFAHLKADETADRDLVA